MTVYRDISFYQKTFKKLCIVWSNIKGNFYFNVRSGEAGRMDEGWKHFLAAHEAEKTNATKLSLQDFFLYIYI